MSIIPLETTGRGTVLADGSAVVAIGPQVYGETWTVNYVSINSDSAAKTHVDEYRNVVSPTTYKESSALGNGDVSDTVHKLSAGDLLVFKWTGGTPGANVWVTVRGDKDTGR